MTKFVLLYNGGGMPESEAEQAAVLKALGRLVYGGWKSGCRPWESLFTGRQIGKKTRDCH